MTKKKNLTAFMIAIIVMLFSLPTNAQETVGYVEWDGANTLTFKGGTSVPAEAFALNTGSNDPDWNNYDARISCTKVVFDASFNDVRPTSCHRWFREFSNLSTIEGIEYLNTANVKTMNAMFEGCSGLTTLDLSSFNTAKVTDMGNMFYGCSDLTKIYVSNDFTTDKVSNSDQMFKDCTNLKGKVQYDSKQTDKNMANYKTGYFTESNLTPYVKWNGDTKVLTFKVANYIEGTAGEWKFNEGHNASEWVGYVYSDCEKVVFTPSFKQAKPTSCNSWFNGFSNLSIIEGIGYLNTDNVTDMNAMFFGCSGLTTLDVSKFNTAKVTQMVSMFGNCSGLTSLDLSSFNTANVKWMTSMFNDCSNLTTIYVSDDFTTDKVNNTQMFLNCTNLEGAVKFDRDKLGTYMANYKNGYFKTYFALGDSKEELCGESLTTTRLDLSDDMDFVAHAPFTVNTATYTRDLSSSESTWFSLCLPFAYTPQKFTAYRLQSATANAVEIKEITGEIVAGTPVLFKFDGEDKKININITATDDKIQIVKAPVVGTAVSGSNGSSLQLCGTYQEKTFSLQDGNTFIIYKERLMNPAKMLENDNVTKVGVKPFRAYMTMTSQAGASAKSFSIGSGDEGTTAIDLLNSVATGDAGYYDINGRRIDAPAKGVNIVRRGNKTMKLIIK